MKLDLLLDTLLEANKDIERDENEAIMVIIKIGTLNISVFNLYDAFNIQKYLSDEILYRHVISYDDRYDVITINV